MDEEPQKEIKVLSWGMDSLEGVVIPKWEHRARSSALAFWTFFFLDVHFEDRPPFLGGFLEVGQLVALVLIVLHVVSGVVGWVMCRIAKIRHITYYGWMIEENLDKKPFWDSRRINFYEKNEGIQNDT